MNASRWITFCFYGSTALALSACAAFNTRPATTTATPPQIAQAPATAVQEPSQTAALLRFAHDFAALSPEAQKREYNQIHSARRSETSRMQLVMISVVPGSRYKDDARATALVDEYLKSDGRDEGLRTLATTLKSLLAAPRQETRTDPRQEENMALLMQKLKDEQKRADTLQRKLDELLAVEKTLYDRRENQPK